MAEQHENVSVEEINRLMEDDIAFVAMANRIRLSMPSSPTQSNFRVLAILVVRHGDGQLRLVVGANSEQGYIGGAICAERAAICRLRFLVQPVILRVVVVTDSIVPISPGALCREYLMSVASAETVVVIGNADGSSITDTTCGAIWPFPYQYRLFLRQDILPQAAIICQQVQAKANSSAFPSDMQEYADKVLAAARAVNNQDTCERLHPIKLSAAIVYEDLSTSSAWILKGLEYGCTLDPVLQVIAAAEQRRLLGDSQPKPIMLAMVDQFGVLHAPFGQARALLVEHGYALLQVLVHDTQGVLTLTTADALYPPPGTAQILTHDTFSLCTR